MPNGVLISNGWILAATANTATSGVNVNTMVKLNLSLFILFIPVFIYFMKRAKLKDTGRLEVVKQQKIHNRYVIYTHNVLTRKRFRRIVMKFSSMACYDFERIKKESVELFERSVLLAVAMPLVALFAFKNVTLMVLTGFVGYIYYDIVVDNAIDKLYTRIVEELSYTIQSIHDNYTLTDSIPQAILNCERSSILERPMVLIYDILMDVNGDEILYQLKRTTPVRLIGTLASICYINNNEGDVRGTGAESAFSAELTGLRMEADKEVRRLLLTKQSFKSLSGLALVGLIASPLCDWFLLSRIPGTALYIKGMYGSFEKAIVIGVTIIAYYLISILTRPSVVNQVDKVSWIDNLSKNKKVKPYIENIQPKKYRTRAKLHRLLKDSISSKDENYVYTSKVIYSGIAMLGALFVIVTFLLTARFNLSNNYSTLSFIPDSTKRTERTAEQLKMVDEIYMHAKPSMSREETVNLLKSKVSDLTDMDAEAQADRLETKLSTLNSLTFKWYYFIVAYLAGVIGWFAPEMSLTLRRMLVKFEETEDVLQLQSIMITLSNTKMDVYKALYWLMSESTVHKAPFRYAYIEFPADPDLALMRLKDSVRSKDLKRLISKLEKSVYDLSLGEAFSDISLDKAQSLVINEMLQTEMIKSKKESARLYAQAPITLTLMAGFVIPILLLGVSKLMSAFSTM